MRRLTTIILLFFLLLLTGCNDDPNHEIAAETFPVIRVVDGDTLIVDRDGTEERIRLIGIDTPESVHPDESRNVEYGEIASEFTESKLEDQAVTLEYDVQERDQYGRILAYVYLNGEMFNKTLLEEGHAKVATYPPNVKYVEEFTALQEKAREEKKGIWAFDALEESVVSKDAEPQNTASQGTALQNAASQGAVAQAGSEEQAEEYYIGNSNTKKFHRPSCRYTSDIKPENIVNIEQRTDAMDQGFEPCKVCKP